MFGKSLHLFRIFGFSVKVDLSWSIIAVLVTWSLAVTVFPEQNPGLSPATYWVMGLGGLLGLFASIVLHELSHSLAARRFDLPMRGITLFIFGGVAEMDNEPPSPLAEFMMAIAGPIASVVIGAGCFGIAQAGDYAGWPVPVIGVFGWLAMINTMLVVFNMVPAFPLDGGRVLRSALWQWKGSIRWATRITSRIGAGFGVFLMVAGGFLFVAGNPIAGMWYVLIGFFVRGAAQMSYRQLLMRRALEGEPVRRFMNPAPVTVAPETSLADLVERYVYEHHHKMFPVIADGQLRGCVTTRDIRKVPHEEWSFRTVGEIAQPCGRDNTIAADTDAMAALTRMNRSGVSRVMVIDDGGRLAGVLSLKDLLRFLALKVELEGEDED